MKKKLLSLALALVMCMCLGVTAFAAGESPLSRMDDEYNSDTMKFYGTGNHSYTAYSTLYVNGSRYRAATWVETMGGNVAAGYMGANGRLFNSSGNLLKETGMIYNTTDYYFQVAVMNSGVYSGNGAYSQGKVRLYNGDHFVSDTLYETETIGASGAPAALLTDQLSDGEYPVNSSGKTYGSAALADIVGYEPDLISAIGTKGQEGYVKREDMQEPDINTPEDALAYMQTRPETYMIPLYNIQGEVIGEFEIGNTMDVSGYTLEDAKERIASGTNHVYPLSIEQTSLVNGNFPKNIHGETYGNGLMAIEVGQEPDLMAAIGTDGQKGYVRTSELDSSAACQTPEEALAWQLSQPNSYYVPLYDFQGNVIGSFYIERSNLTIAEMEALKK